MDTTCWQQHNWRCPPVQPIKGFTGDQILPRVQHSGTKMAHQSSLWYLLIRVLLTIHRAIGSDQQGTTGVQIPGHGTSRLADGSHIARAANVPTAVIPPVPVLQGALYQGIIIDHGCRVVAFVVRVQAVANPFPVPTGPINQKIYSSSIGFKRLVV